jgi:hypothetical protein
MKILGVVVLAVPASLLVLLFAFARLGKLEYFFHWSPPHWEHNSSPTELSEDAAGPQHQSSKCLL